MPELPEVETIRRSLQTCEGQRLNQISFHRLDIIRQKDFEPGYLEGQACTELARRGKYLEFIFPENKYVTVHLGMSGRLWKSTDPAEQQIKHVHMTAVLDSGETLIFYDPRRFGGIWLTYGPILSVQRLGIEPLSSAFQTESWWEKAQKRKASIKQVLLDQRFIAGLGNIYADESLFAAGIHPQREARSLTVQEWKILQQKIVEVLQASLSLKGTTFRDYRDGLNQKGAFQNFLKVYGKSGTPCPHCGTNLEMVRIAQRSSCFCPVCQK